MPTCGTETGKALAHTKACRIGLDMHEKFYWVVGFGDDLRGEKGERTKI